MPTKAYREESRKDWCNGQSDKPTAEQIKLGCLQRIADATESMAKEYNRLLMENNVLKNSRARYRDEAEMLRRRLAATKGVVTRMKRERRELSSQGDSK